MTLLTSSNVSSSQSRKVSGMVLITSIVLSACSSSETPVSAERSGNFIDSEAVEGLTYSTPSLSGVTDTTGAFRYLAGENITFSLGDLILPEVRATSVVTPLDIFDTDSVDEMAVVNLSRLLQSLDSDGDVNNGISIDSSAAESASPVDFSSSDFEQQVVNLVANSGSVNTTLIDSNSAADNLESTLEANAIPASGCTSEHPLVGQEAQFETRHHDVSGTARIVDDCTIQISGFHYDGQGPAVYFYGAVDAQYSSSEAFIIGDQLNGTLFVDDEITLTLPEGRSLNELNGISVWCADFRIDFGAVEFIL